MSVDNESFEVLCSTMHPHLDHDKNMPYMEKIKAMREESIVMNGKRFWMKI